MSFLIDKKNLYLLNPEKYENELFDILKIYDYIYYESGEYIENKNLPKYLQKIINSEPEKIIYGLNDSEYDLFRKKLFELFPNNDYFTKDVIGEKGEIKSKFIMGSLKKFRADSFNVFKRTIKDTKKYLLTEKIDGLSILLHYKKGKLIQALTRGDGIYGKDITHKISLIMPNIKLDVDNIYMRAEAVMIGDKYKELGFSHPRNGASGIINNKLNKNMKYITMIIFEIISCNDPKYNLLDLKDLDMKIPKHMWLKTEDITIDKLTQIYLNWKNDSDYPIDGIVLEPEKYIRENVKLPSRKLAFKHNFDVQWSIVTDIEWSVGLRGRVTPIVSFEPITFDSRIISKATGHNEIFMNNLQIVPGRRIGIIVANEIIPKIEISDLKQKLPKFEIPKKCPYCEGKLIIDKFDGLICENKKCYKVGHAWTINFIKGIGYKGIGEETIKYLDIRNLNDLLKLNMIEIMKIDGFGNSKAMILDTMLKSYIINCSPEKIMGSLGIKNIKEKTASYILENISVNEFLSDDNDYIKNLIRDKIKKENLKDTLLYKYKYIRKTFKILKDYGYILKKNKKTDLFKDLSFVLTGESIPAFKNRTLAKTFIKKNGGDVKTNVSKKTNYVVTDMKINGKKIKDAIKNKIKIISYEDLKHLK